MTSETVDHTSPEADIHQRREYVRRNFWSKLRRVIARVPFAEDLVAAYLAAMDPETPPRVRAILLGALAYFILPADALPDVMAGVGFTDDAAVLAAAIKVVSAHITPTHYAAARNALTGDNAAAEQKDDAQTGADRQPAA